jgi:hypothetical protein
MNFITYEDLVHDSLALAHRLPRDIIGVLAIPRSGLLPASIISAELGCYLGDVYTFAQTGGTFFRVGKRMCWPLPSTGRVLVLDDSLYAGGAMEMAQAMLRTNPALLRSYTFDYGVVYLAPGMEEQLNIFQRIVTTPRLFAWNWLGHGDLEKAACDMDGLLCTDPDVLDNDNTAYEDALHRCKPLHIPRRRLDAIVTGRLERWRDVTTNWLAAHHVEYRELYMAPFKTAAERRAYGAPRWKGEVCKQLEPNFYLESNPKEAQIIAKHAKCPIICPLTGEVWT